MAFRLSDRDRAASQAAAAIRQANRAQKDYESQAAQAQANLNAAQSKPMGGLESVLAGIGEKFNDWGSTIGNIGRTVIGGISEPFRKAETKKINSDDSAKRNEIARRYGFSSYSEAANSDKANDDFWNEIRDLSASTAQRLSEKSQNDRNSLGNVRDIDLNTAKGQSLSTIGDLLQILGPAGNIAGGAIEGVGASYKGAAGGTDADVWGGDNLGRTLGNAAIGGVTAFVGDKVGGKFAGKAGNGKLSKLAHSNIGRGAISGAAAGATGGGLSAALNGGDVLGGALQGAKGGALAGGTMAGAMGLVGAGIDKLNRKYTPDMMADSTATPKANTLEDALQTPQKTIVDEVAEQYTKKQPTRRTIGVQYESDNGPVQVNRERSNQYRLADRSGSTLDGILSPDNETQLPNAKKPTYKADALTVVNSGKMAEPIDTLKRMGVSDDTINALKDAAGAYQRDVGGAALQAYGLDDKGDLPMLNREQYYRDNRGQLAANGGNGNIRAEDVEDYMYGHLRNSAGQNSLGGSQDDNWTILRNLLGERAENMSLDDMYDTYRTLARSASMSNSDTYSPDNIAGALAMDKGLNKRVSQEMYDRLFPANKIDVEGEAPLAQRINVTDRDQGKLIQDITPAKRQAQPQTQAVAETPTRAITQEAETVPRPSIRRATDMSDIEESPNLAPADVARLERQLTVARQKQGNALLEQYGELDAPTRRAVESPADVLATLYDRYGIKTPADLQYATNHVTGKNGIVSQMTRDLASSADGVNTTIEAKWLDDMIKLNGLKDSDAKAVKAQIVGALNRGGESVDGNTALDVMKQLQEQAADYKGKSGTYHRPTGTDARKAKVLSLVHDEIQDRLWDAAGDAQKVVTPKRLEQLRKMYDGNETWGNFVDSLRDVKTGAELRSTMKPLVDGAKILNGSEMSAGSFGSNMRKLVTGGHPVQALGQTVYDLAVGSERAKQSRAAKQAGKAANIEAQLRGETPVKTNNGGIVGVTKNVATKAGKTIGGVADMLNNDTFTNSALGNIATRGINRRIGQGEAQAIGNRAALQEAQQQVMDINNNYNNAMTQAQQMYNQAQQMGNSSNSTLDRIASGMERALAAGDINAYSQLADLYQQAYKIYGLQNPEATSNSSGTKDLTVNQSKAYAGLQQLGQLSQMTPDLGTALASTPASGLVNLFGGNEYANQAKALATTIGYLLSGANIREQEAERIGQAYVPSAFDSDTVKRQKLSRAEQLLRSYLSDSSALQ